MLYVLGDALTKLTWAEMNKVSCYLVDATNNQARNGEDVDPHFVSDLLVEIGESIVKEVEAEAAAMPRNTEAS